MRSGVSSQSDGDTANEGTLVLGEITAASGLKGDIRVRSFTRPDTEIFDYNPWILGDIANAGVGLVKPGWQTDLSGLTFQLLRGKRSGKHLVASLSGVDSREQAEALIGLSIGITREQLTQPADGEYYWDDLAGLGVRNVEGTALGIVDHLVETGANDVLVVRTKGDDPVEERLIPWIDDVIVSVDLEKGVLTVDWDENY